MAKYMRREELVVNTFAFKMFGKRLCDLNKDELRAYNRLKKRISRENGAGYKMEDMLSGKKYK